MRPLTREDAVPIWTTLETRQASRTATHWIADGQVSTLTLVNSAILHLAASNCVA